ncbi:MAG: DASS family sodium-coupled anion symporter [Candidatus Hydrogenedentes bacterium]|nr:DASS family sodium-coupled anion symporter [Candidatus Hydrogenedentota bacterium]
MACMSESGEAPVPFRIRAGGLIAGPVLFAAVLFGPHPAGLSEEAQRVAAVTVLMGVWWVTETIPLAAASLVPLVAFPLLNVMKAGDTAVCYGDSTIFLFAGGFFIAMAMQQWRLHERVALHIIRTTGTNPRRLVLGFMIASAFISLWISNAATTMMMLPIALAVIQQFEKEHGEAWVAPFGTAVMLGIAYASSIGGVGTIVGTAPNVIFLGLMAKLFPEAPRITFGQWLFFGIPLVAVFVPLAWWILARWIYRLPGGERHDPRGDALIGERLRALGGPSRGEMTVGAVFLLTAFAWVFRQDIPLGGVTIPGWTRVLPDPKSVDDGTVAIMGALLLFVLPVDVRAGKFALEWEWAKRIPWGILLLFGGGLAIAKGFDQTGLVDWVGEQLAFPDRAHGPGPGQRLDERVGHPSPVCAGARGVERLARVHDARGHPTQRPRVRQRVRDHPADDACGVSARCNFGGAGDASGVFRDCAGVPDRYSRGAGLGALTVRKKSSLPNYESRL